MPNLLERGATWLGAKLKSEGVAGRTVRYVRKGRFIAELECSVAMQDYEVLQDDGSLTLVKSFDYTITAADLVLNGSLIEPRQGDQIIETIAGAVRTFEVVMLGNKPCFEWQDTAGILLLVHTQRIANEDV